MAAKNPQEVLADYRELIAHLRHLLGTRGATMREAAGVLSLSPMTVQRLAVRHRLRHRTPRRLTPAQRDTADRLIRQGHHSLEQLRRLIGISKSAVVRRRQRILDHDAEVTFRPKRRREAQYCPGCQQLVFYEPCIICQARQG